MKFTLTITDATADELASILANRTATARAVAAPMLATLSAMPTTGVIARPSADDDSEGEVVNTAAPLYDTTGLPWDERIHAATKATTDDGSWRKRRGIGKDVVAAVEAELRSRSGSMTLPSQPVMQHMQTMPAQPVMQAMQPMLTMPAFAAPIAAQPVMPLNPEMFVQPVMQPMPLNPQMFVQGGIAPQQPVMQPIPALDFNGFMQGLAAQMQSGQVDHAYLSKFTAEIGTAFNAQLNAITDIASNPNMITYAVQILQRDGKWHA